MSEVPRTAPSIRRFLFFDEHRPTRAWMPTLEMINERFAQYCRAALLQHLQPPVEMVPQFAIEAIKHSELIDRLATPSHLTLVTLKPLRGTILIAVEAELVGMIVESRFGGSGRLPVVAVPNREFAPIEHQAMGRVVERLLDQLALAWKPVAAFVPEIVRHEVKPAFAAIANSTDLVIVTSFAVTVANGSGKLMIAIPYLLLEPLHDRLVASVVDRAVTRDPRWSEELKIGIGRATTELKVEFAAIEMTVRDFLNLRPGNVFEINRPDTVTVQAHGIPLFRGRWGRHGQKIAVRVEERLPPKADAPVVGGSHGNGDGNDNDG
jgi:flagellar motor switch protein FliM